MHSCVYLLAQGYVSIVMIQLQVCKFEVKFLSM